MGAEVKLKGCGLSLIWSRDILAPSSFVSIPAGRIQCWNLRDRFKWNVELIKSLISNK